MSKLLIVGAGTLQIPAIKKAKEMGFEVAVVDLNPLAPGVHFADLFFEISTIDEEKIVKAAIDYQPDGVMTMATDMPMRSVARVASALNLHSISYEVAEKATDKVKMIECFREHNVPHPWFKVFIDSNQFKTELNNISLPFIIKPSDSSGSKGVVLVESLESAYDAFSYSQSCSKSGTVLVEEFMVGSEVSVETLTINDETHVIAITDKLTSGSPYFVEMGHSQPSQHGCDIVEQIVKVAKEAITAIGINNSPAHIEMILTKNGPKLVELGARLGGDCISSHLVPLSTGIDMVKSCIELSVGLIPNIQVQYSKGAAIRYISSEQGVFKGITGIEVVEKLKGIKQIEIVKSVGDIVGLAKGSGDRIGYIVAQADTAAHAIEVCNNSISLLSVLVE